VAVRVMLPSVLTVVELAVKVTVVGVAAAALSEKQDLKLEAL